MKWFVTNTLRVLLLDPLPATVSSKLLAAMQLRPKASTMARPLQPTLFPVAPTVHQRN